MQKISLLLALIGSLFAGFSFADIIDTNAIMKIESDEYLATGQGDGELFWNYSVNGVVQFRVANSLAEQVDNLIEMARETGLTLVLLDNEVTHLCDAQDVFDNLVLIDATDDEGVEDGESSDEDGIVVAFLLSLSDE